MTFDMLLSGICIRLQDFTENSFFECWSWKTDPWKDTALFPISNDSVVHITKAAPSSAEMGPLPLLYAEKTGFFERRVYGLPDNGTLWDLVRVREDRVYLRFLVSTDWNTITLLTDLTGTQGSAAFEYLAQILPAVFLKHDILTFHGALVEYEGQGIVISAASGVGKTTHARLWRDCRNALILNGDRAVCKRTEQGWLAYGTPWSGTSGEQINRHVPLRALVVLERGEVNTAGRLTPMAGFSAMLPHLLCPTWDAELTGKAMEQMDDLFRAVPVYRLQCRPDKEAVEVLYRAMQEA